MADPKQTAGALADRAWRSTRGFLATRRGKLIAGGAAAVLLIGAGGGSVFAATRTDDSRYRTATAALGEVTETLALTGQVSSSTSASAAFQVSGTVGEVLVQPGDAVTAGQTLAALDTDELEASVTSAEDAVASAEQQLQDDLDAQSSGSGSAASGFGGAPGAGSSPRGSGSGETGAGSGGWSPGGSGQGGTGAAPAPTPSPTRTPAPTPSPTPGAGDGDSDGSGSDGSGSDDGADPAPDHSAVTAASQAVSDAQTALLAQYETSAAAQKTSSAAAADAQDVCAPFLDATLNADGTVETDEDAAAASDALAATRNLLADCQASISDTLDKQKATSAAQKALDEKAQSLDDAVAALQKAIAEAESAASAGTDAATSSLRSNGGSGFPIVTASVVTASIATGSAVAVVDPSGGTGQAGGSSATITSQQILADRAQIDLAKADLAVAEQELAFATLTSPIAGEVVAVSLAAGDAVSAGSTTALVTVQSAGGYIVHSTVPLSKIAKVAVGQTAEVTLPAFGRTYPATVASIGVLDESATSTPAYTVTLSLDTGDDDVRIGATAQAVLSLSTATDVLTVPTSAVTVSGTRTTVVVLRDGKAETVSVELGAVGSERTEITKGLEEGDMVVLADLTRAIPSGDDGAATSLSDLGGGSMRGSGRFPNGRDFPSGGLPGARPGS